MRSGSGNAVSALLPATNSASLFYDASGRNMTAYNTDYDSTSTLASSQRGYINKTGTDNAPGQIYAGTVRPMNRLTFSARIGRTGILRSVTVPALTGRP